MTRRGVVTLVMVAETVWERCDRDAQSGRWRDFEAHCRRRYGLHPGQDTADKLEVLERIGDRF